MTSVAFVVMFFVCAAATKLYCLLAHNTRLMDKPNERSMHSKPTIRGGGLVFIVLPLLVLPWLCCSYQTSFYACSLLLTGAAAIAVVSFWDDLYHLSVKPRFVVQALVALLLAVFLQPLILNLGFFNLQNPVLSSPFLFLGLLWSINHFNFMDGIDGLCALQALFLFAAYALLFSLASDWLYRDFCFLLVASLSGFLVFNFPPARLFMGDVGSATLGFLVFCLALIAEKQDQIPLIYWFMLNALFLFDATLTLIRRLLRKEKWFSPHRKHAYQRLKQTGLNTRWILLGQALCNLLFLVLTLLVQAKEMPLFLALLVQLGVLSAIYTVVEKLNPMD